MRILGIDTALRCTGFGIVEYNESGTGSIIECGFIKTPAKKPVSECLRRLSGGIRELIEHYAPDEVAIEGTFFNKYARTAMLLGMARGAAVSTCALYSLPIYEYAPMVAKRAVTGNGSSSKEQVAFMMANMFKINIGEMPLDATDALSLAVCHYQNCRMPEQIRCENLI